MTSRKEKNQRTAEIDIPWYKKLANNAPAMAGAAAVVGLSAVGYVKRDDLFSAISPIIYAPVTKPQPSPTPRPSPVPFRPPSVRLGPEQLRPESVEAVALKTGEAHYSKNYVVVNLVDGLTVELNTTNIDRLYSDPRVRIRVQEKEQAGITPVNLLFIAPLGGVSTQKDILDHMLLVDPMIPEIKEEYKKRFLVENPSYKSSSLPFHSTVRAAGINTTPSVGQREQLANRMSEDFVRASIQAMTIPMESPLFALAAEETRLVLELQPIKVLNVDTQAIIKAFNP